MFRIGLATGGGGRQVGKVSQAVRLLPPVGLLLLGVHLAFASLRPDAIVADPGVGWHIKLGEWMVRDRVIPAEDPLSWSLPGARWIDYQWGTHAVMGLLHQGGLRLVAAAWLLAYGVLVLGLYVRLLRRGVALPVAWAMAFAAWLVLAVHFQARPHVWTYLLFPVLLGLLRRMQERRHWQDGAGAAALFLVWPNLHAGFVAGLVAWGAFGLGEVGALAWKDRAAGMRLLGRHAGWGLLAVLLSLANPWGWNLHAHIVRHLGADSHAFWHEAQPPWAVGGLNVGVFWVLGALVLAGAAARVRGVRAGEWACALVMLAFACSAVRHMTLFVLAALPAAALAVQAGLVRVAGFRPERWVAWTASECRLPSLAGWALVLGLGWGVWAVGGASPLRADLRGLHVSAAALDALAADPEGLQPLVHPENLGGVMAYQLAPGFRVFADDRLDYYKDDFFIGQYLPLMRAEPGWREALEQRGARGVLVPREGGLGRALAQEKDWSLVWGDERHVLYRRAKRPEAR